MAAISITAGNFIPSVNAVLSPVYTAGATFAKGSPGYYDSSAGTAKLCGAASTAAVATCIGLAAYAAGSGQPVQFVKSDPALVLGATLLAGDDVWVHTTAGSLTKTIADLSSGNYKVHIGTMTSTTAIDMKITGPGLVA